MRDPRETAREIEAATCPRDRSKAAGFGVEMLTVTFAGAPRRVAPAADRNPLALRDPHDRDVAVDPAAAADLEVAAVGKARNAAAAAEQAAQDVAEEPDDPAAAAAPPPARPFAASATRAKASLTIPSAMWFAVSSIREAKPLKVKSPSRIMSPIAAPTPVARS